MFFVALTLALIACIAGGMLLVTGKYLLGGIVLVVGIFMILYTLYAYSKNKFKKYDCVPDCMIIDCPYLPDCDILPDCDLPDCN